MARPPPCRTTAYTLLYTRRPPMGTRCAEGHVRCPEEVLTASASANALLPLRASGGAWAQAQQRNTKDPRGLAHQQSHGHFCGHDPPPPSGPLSYPPPPPFEYDVFYERYGLEAARRCGGSSS